MFKFRRSSLCSNPEVVSNNSSSDDEPKLSELCKGSLRNSVSESRLEFSYNSPDEKESLSSSSLDSVVPSPDNVPLESLDPIEGELQETEETQGDGIFEKCNVGIKKESAPVTIAMCDRKRKERHESSSQEQEKKVIRGNDAEPAEVRLTKSTTGDAVVPISEKDSSQFAEVTAAVKSGDIVKSIPPSHTAPQVGYGMRTMPMDFEPEVQRQWERTAAQWNSRKTRRPHRSLPTGRSGKSSTEVDGISQRGVERSQSSGPAVHMHSQGKELKEQMSSERESVSELESDVGQDPFDDENEIPQQPTNLAHLPSLDLSTLHENIDSLEPISACRLSCSSDHAVLSPRNHTLIRDAIGIPHVPLHQSPVHPPPTRQDVGGIQDSRINGLYKQIQNYKKQIKQLELEFERFYGRKPSQTDRQNHKDIRKYLLQISRAKRELQMIREDSGYQNNNIDSLVTKKLRLPGSFTVRARGVSDEALQQLQDLVGQIHTVLDDNRKSSGRPEDPMLMTQQELVSEKNSMQKQLLVLERRHGRPETREEKEIVKPLYSRYRLVKKLSFRHSAEMENSFDLVPINEHETLEFSADSRRESMERDSKEVSQPKMDSAKSKENRPSTSSVEVIDLKNEDFNEMSLPELESKHKLASDEKKRLRTILRKFEVEFQNNTGRVAQKEDKYSTNDMELLYQKYKHFRANTKLLGVLIAKKKYPFSVSELGKVED